MLEAINIEAGMAQERGQLFFDFEHLPQALQVHSPRFHLGMHLCKPLYKCTPALAHLHTEFKCCMHVTKHGNKSILMGYWTHPFAFGLSFRLTKYCTDSSCKCHCTYTQSSPLVAPIHHLFICYALNYTPVELQPS